MSFISILISRRALKSLAIMKIADIQFRKFVDLNLALFTSLMLFIYAMSYRPFITESYLPVAVRIGIEGFVLSILAIINLRYQHPVKAIWFIFVALIFNCVLFFEMDTFVKVISAFNKLIFLILVIGLFVGNQNILNTCIKIWVRFSYFMCIGAILAFIGCATGTIPFPPIQFEAHYYLHNPILGNLTPYFGTSIGRVAGYMYEAGLFGVLLGLNILVARDWIEDDQKRKRFILVNLVAGLATISTTFILFFGAYFLIQSIFVENKLNLRIKIQVFISVCVLIAALIWASDFFVHRTSSVDRLERMNVYLSVIENNTLQTFMLGSGVGITLKKFGMGIDPGWVAIFVERGAVMLAFIVSLYVMLTKHNRWLMFYVLYVNFAFNMFWDPSFLLVVAMSYVCFRYKRRGLVAAERLPTSFAAQQVITVEKPAEIFGRGQKCVF